jgi:hypothetical protein
LLCWRNHVKWIKIDKGRHSKINLPIWRQCIHITWLEHQFPHSQSFQHWRNEHLGLKYSPIREELLFHQIAKLGWILTVFAYDAFILHISSLIWELIRDSAVSISTHWALEYLAYMGFEVLIIPSHSSHLLQMFDIILESIVKHAFNRKYESVAPNPLLRLPQRSANSNSLKYILLIKKEF